MTSSPNAGRTGPTGGGMTPKSRVEAPSRRVNLKQPRLDADFDNPPEPRRARMRLFG